MDTRHHSRTQFVRAALLCAALLAAALSLQSAGFAAPAARAAGVPLTPVAATAAIEFPAPADMARPARSPLQTSDPGTDSKTLPRPLLVAPVGCGSKCSSTSGDSYSPLEVPAELSPPALVAPRACSGSCAATARVHFCEPGPVLSSVASPTAPDRDSIRCPFEVDRRPDGQAMQIAGGEPPIVVDSCARRACRG